MAAEVTRLPQLKLPAGPSPRTPEQTYWQSFRSQQLIPSPSSYPVTHISSPPPNPGNLTTSNDLFAVTTGLRVQLYSIKTRKLVKTITRFEETAYSGDIRRDGRVMVAGDDAGAIQVFDVNSRAILKTWKEHRQPVWTTRFSPTETTTLMSTSDDRTVRLWDLPSQESVTTFAGHADYVRTGAFMPGSASRMLVSGSYDTTVRLWDSRAPPSRAAMIFKHAFPVESVLPLPSGTTILASADNQISVLDVVAGKPLRLLQNHQKTVTSLALASNGTRLMSGGLDGHLKVFETTEYNIVAGRKYPSPILSLTVVPTRSKRDEDRHLVVGMANGTLSIRTRLSGQQKVKERERQKEMDALIAGNLDVYDKDQAKRAKKQRHLVPGKTQDFSGEGADIIIAGNDRRPKKELPWQNALRKGHYPLALSLVLCPTPSSTSTSNSNNQSRQPLPPLTILTLLKALIHRSALHAALSTRTETTLAPLLRWLTRYLPHPAYQSICVEVIGVVLDLFGADIGAAGSGEVVDDDGEGGAVLRLLRSLKGVVAREVVVKRGAGECKGGVEMVMLG
ncbi:MAG: hypothetical protein M1817_003446 [Caeruleum heppii]|nr:MAG: hypothetical protein M1817_003446 [Caeruleum heppii]